MLFRVLVYNDSYKSPMRFIYEHTAEEQEKCSTFLNSLCCDLEGIFEETSLIEVYAFDEPLRLAVIKCSACENDHNKCSVDPFFFVG